MCLPCGSSLGLTNAASKHSPSAVLRRRPCGSLLKGERPGGWAPGGVCPGSYQPFPFSWWRTGGGGPFLQCFAWWGGVGEATKDGWKRFLFFLSLLKIRSIPSHSWKTTIPPAVSECFGFEKHTFCLLPFASVDLFRAAITFRVNEYGAEAFINVSGRQAPVV